MRKNRRSFLRSVGVATAGITTVGMASELSAADARQWKEVAANATGPVSSESKTDHAKQDLDNQVGNSPHHLFSSSHVRLLEVFKNNTYGWQAEVGLTGCAQALQYWDPDDDWKEGIGISRTEYDVLNGQESYNPPVVDEGYRGFSPQGDEPDITIPDWVEPGFDTGVSTLIAFASSNPWTGAGAAVALSADDILEALNGDDGKSSIGDDVDGYRVSHVPQNCIGPFCWDKTESQMTHFQRITGRFGSFEPGTELEIESRFNHEWTPEVETSFDVYAWDEDAGSVASTGSNEVQQPENLSDEQKKEFGYVEVSGGTPENPVVQDADVADRIESLNERVEGEVEAVLLDPPAKIE